MSHHLSTVLLLPILPVIGLARANRAHHNVPRRPIEQERLTAWMVALFLSLATAIAFSLSSPAAAILWLPPIALLLWALWGWLVRPPEKLRLPDWREWLVTAGQATTAFLLGLGAWLHLPLRGALITSTNAVGALYWGDVTHLAGVFGHATGRSFQPLMFGVPLEEVLLNVARFCLLFVPVQAGWWLLPFIVAGAAFAALTRPTATLVMGVYLYTLVMWNSNYAIVDIQVFFIPAVAILLLLVGTVLESLVSGLARRSRIEGAVAAMLVLLTPVYAYTLNYGHNNLSRYFIAHDYASDVLHTLEGRSFLLTQGWITPYLLGYLQASSEARLTEFDRVHLLVEGKQRLFKRIVTGDWLLPEGYRAYTTVPFEVSGGTKSTSRQRGIIFELGRGVEPLPPDTTDYWRIYRPRLEEAARGLSGRFLDHQSRSLLAKYAYMRGARAIALGDVNAGLALCEEALVISPRNQHVANNLSAIYFKHGLPEEALRMAELAVSIDPGFQQSRHNLFNIHYRMGNYDAAMREFRINRTMHWRLDFVRHIIGDIELKRGNYRQAINEFRAALSADRDNPLLRSQLGRAQALNGELDAARQSFEEAITHPDASAEVWNNHGWFLMQSGAIAGARASFLRAIALDAGQADAHNNLGALYAKQQDFAAAVGHFRQAVDARPSFTTAWNNLGGAALSLEDYPTALDAFRRSLALAPQQPKVQDYVERLTAAVEGTPASP